MAHSVGLIWNILKVTLNPITKTIMKLLPYSDNLGFRKWTPWMAPIAFYVLSRLLVLSCNGLTRDGLCRFCCLCSFYHPESFFFFFFFKSFPTLFSAILCVVEFAPHHIFSQDFQSQEIPGQDTKAESSHSQWIQMKTGNKMGTAPREDIGEESDWVRKNPCIWSAT